MVEGSPRRVSVASHDATIKMTFNDEEEKPENPLPQSSEQGVANKTETAQPTVTTDSPSRSRWKKLRTTVQLGNAVYAHHRKPPLKREDSFLQRFSTRPQNTPTNPSQPTKILRMSTVLNPDESLLFWWLWVVTLCGLHNSWTLIVRQAFPEFQEAHPTLWNVLDGCSDAVYVLDIVVQFRTGYLEQGIMVRDAGRLAKHYLTSRDFFLDVAALIPLDFIYGVTGESPLLRFPRFLKARRIYKFYYAVESRTAYPNFWRVANLIHVLLLLAHWFGCFYYMLSELEGFQGSWAYRHPESEESPLIRKYLGSVYWSTLTLTTIGDLATPATNLQYLFTIISYLIGVFIFATIVGQVGNVITNRNASRLEFERLLDGAKLYMRHHKVPKGMQRRVQRWYDYSWSRGRMQGGGDIHSALGILPDKLKTELAIHVNLKTLKKVSIFQECQPEFLHDLVLKMKAYIFTPGDLVCRKGEVAREMFIIADGILQVINEKGQVLTQMNAGDFFGEIGILNLDGFNRRTADVRSVGYSELFSLSREDVLSAMKDYPEAEEILQSMGRKRLMEARRTNNPDGERKGSTHSDAQRQESQRGNIDNRQRKKGISLSNLLKSKKDNEHDNPTYLQQKFSNLSFISEESKNNSSREQNFSELIEKFGHVRHKTFDDVKFLPNNSEDSPTMNSFIDHIIHKQNKGIPPKRKRSLWCKLAKLVHLRRWRKLIADQSEQNEPKFNHCDTLQTNDAQSHHSSKLSLSPVDNRRTSWQPSKPSISNWNRSELFTESIENQLAKKRRKTLADAGMILKTNLCQEKSQKKLPGILMTGSGLNSSRIDSPDISPISSNCSLVPSTSEEENNEEKEKRTSTKNTLSEPTVRRSSVKVPKLPSEIDSMQQFVAKVMCDFKATMDSYIAETEKDMCLRILQLEEEIKTKDATIKNLQMQFSKKVRRASAGVEDDEKEEENVEEEQTVNSSPKSSPQKRISKDSAICSIDILSPPEPAPDIHFEKEELWLVEFPLNAPPPVPIKRPRLRRHSSVEVGHEVPFRLASQKSDDTFLRPAVPRDGSVSPRRFSESQARPDVILSNSFADRVRRVFAKVKSNRQSDDSSEESSSSPPLPFKWPMLSTPKTRRPSLGSSGNDKQLRLQQTQRCEDTLERGSEGAKRLLPTIAESCSFDSLKESPLMELKLQTVSIDEEENNKDTVVIDMGGTSSDTST